MHRYISLIAFCITFAPLFAETYQLKDGSTVGGKIAYSNDTLAVIEGSNGVTHMIPLSQFQEETILPVQPEAPQNNNLDKTVKTNELKNFSIFAQILYGGLLSDNFHDYIKSGLHLNPSILTATGAGIGLDWYFMKYIGLSAGYDFSFIEAYFSSSDNGTCCKPLTILDCQTIKLLAIARIPIYQFPLGCLMIDLSAGPNLNFVDYAQDYKKSIEAANYSRGFCTIWYGPAHGFGFTGGAGVSYQFYSYHIGLDLTLQYKSFQFPQAVSSLGYLEFGLQMRIGADF